MRQLGPQLAEDRSDIGHVVVREVQRRDLVIALGGGRVDERPILAGETNDRSAGKEYGRGQLSDRSRCLAGAGAATRNRKLSDDALDDGLFWGTKGERPGTEVSSPWTDMPYDPSAGEPTGKATQER